MLGLGNAATPLGLRAMKDLESLNPRPGTATNAMCTFLAINTASIQLIPVTAIAILAAAKSTAPTAIVGTALIATACACTTGVAVAKLLEKLPWFRLPPLTPALSPSDGERGSADRSGSESAPIASEGDGRRLTSAATKKEEEKPAVKEAATLQPLTWWGMVLLGAFVLFFAVMFARMAFPAAFGIEVSAEVAKQSAFVRIVGAVSKLSIPLLLAGFPLYAALRRVKVYEEFVDGAKEGFDVAIRIIPYLVAILVAIGMFRAAGGIDLLSRALAPVMTAVGFPSDLLPLVLMRPLSGSGSLGLFTELVTQFGPDSLIARTGGTIFGSTETTFYVLAVYFGSVGIKRTRHALICGLTADMVSVIVSVIVCRLVFG
jgi:spore maturation protein SpmB